MAGSRFAVAGSGLLRRCSAVCWAVMVARCKGAAHGGGGLFAAALGSPSLAARLARSSRAGGCVDARRRWILGSPNLVPPCVDLAPQCGPIGHRSQVRLSLLSVGWASAMEELALSFLRLDQQLQLILATTSPNDVCVFHIVPET